MMSLLTLKEVREQFVGAGVNIALLKELKETAEECELGSNNKMLVGQLT